MLKDYLNTSVEDMKSSLECAFLVSSPEVMLLDIVQLFGMLKQRRSAEKSRQKVLGAMARKAIKLMEDGHG